MITGTVSRISEAAALENRIVGGIAFERWDSDMLDGALMYFECICPEGVDAMEQRALGVWREYRPKESCRTLGYWRD